MSLFGDFKNSGSSFWSVGAGKFVSTALLRRRRLDKAPEPLASIPQPFHVAPPPSEQASSAEPTAKRRPTSGAEHRAASPPTKRCAVEGSSAVVASARRRSPAELEAIERDVQLLAPGAARAVEAVRAAAASASPYEPGGSRPARASSAVPGARTPAKLPRAASAATSRGAEPTVLPRYAQPRQPRPRDPWKQETPTRRAHTPLAPVGGRSLGRASTDGSLILTDARSTLNALVKTENARRRDELLSRAPALPLSLHGSSLTTVKVVPEPAPAPAAARPLVEAELPTSNKPTTTITAVRPPAAAPAPAPAASPYLTPLFSARGTSSKRVAVIVTGQLRGTVRALEEFRNKLRALDVDIFVSSYSAYAHQAKVLGVPKERQVLVDDAHNGRIPVNGAKQWVLLQLGVRKFREAWLKDYDVVARMRTDMLYLEGFEVAAVGPRPDTVHMLSDNYFYASARHFVAVCDSIYDRYVDSGYWRSVETGRVLVPHWRNLAASTFVRNSRSMGLITHPTRWYLLFYPRELFGGCTPGSYASMREVLDAKLDTLCLRHSGAATGGAVAASECTRLPPKGMKMVESGFDSEASFLHHCLENGRVDRTGAEYTCMLRPRGPTASMSPARSGG